MRHFIVLCCLCVCLSHQMCLEGLFALGSEWTFSTAIPTFKSGQRATLCASCQAKLSSTFMYNTQTTDRDITLLLTTPACLYMCVYALFLQGYGSKFDETHDVPFNPDLIQPYGAHTKKKRGYRYCTASFLLSPTLSNTLSLSHTLLPRPKASEAWANKKRERVVKRETDHWVHTSTMPTLSSPRLL